MGVQEMKLHNDTIFCLAALTAAMALAALVGEAITRERPEDEPIPNCPVMELPRAENDGLTEWEVMELAIAYTESKFNHSAVGKDKDYGILQITPIYVEEVNRLGGDYSHADAFDIDKSLEMFEILQAHHNPERDIKKGISLHNKSKYYLMEVENNIALIRRMETARAKILDARKKRGGISENAQQIRQANPESEKYSK
jgi:hypothetical protein